MDHPYRTAASDGEARRRSEPTRAAAPPRALLIKPRSFGGVLRRVAFLTFLVCASVVIASAAGLVHGPHGADVLEGVAAAQGSGDELTIVGQFGGDATAVAADGNRLYAGLGPRVAVVDMTDPQSPKLMGQTDVLPGVVVDMDFEDGYVYAIAGGLVVIDVRNPVNPVQVGFVSVGEYEPLYGWVGPAHIDVSDGYAYMAGNVSYQIGRLHIVDVTDPRNPTVASRFEEYTATSVAVFGSLAYLSLRACFGPNCTPDHVAMLVLDVTDPASPQVLGDYAEPRGATHVVAAGTTALLLNSRCPLAIVDASDPGAPRLTDCVDMQTMQQPVDVAVSGSIAYVLSQGRVSSIELTGGRARARDSLYVAPLGSAVAATGDRVYSAHDAYGIGTVDSGDPSNMRRLSVVQRPGSFTDVVVDGSMAYVGGLYTGLHVIDTSDVANLQQVGYASSTDGLMRVVKIGQTVYGLATPSGSGAGTSLRAYDVATPSSPREIGSQSRADLNDIATDGRLLYVTDGDGLSILDPSADPADPPMLGNLPEPSQSMFTRVVVDDGLAYVVLVRSGGRNRYTYELRVVNVSSPSSPFQVGALQLAADVPAIGGTLGVTGIAVRDSIVYMASSVGYYSGYVDLPFPLDQYLIVVDATQSSQPRLAGTWTTYERIAPNGLLLSGRWLYLGTWAGVRVFDAIVPPYPKPVTRLDTPEIDIDDILGMVEAPDGRLYLARLDAGLLVVDADVPPPPTPTPGPLPSWTPTVAPFPTLTPGAPTSTNTQRPGPTRRPTRTPTPTLRPGETPSWPTLGPPPTRTLRPTRGPSPTASSTGNATNPSATATQDDRTPVVVPTGSVTSTYTPSSTVTGTGPRPSVTPTFTATTTPTGTVTVGPEPGGIYLPFTVVERRSDF